MLRIAHVVSTFPPHIGGMGTVCFNEAFGLGQMGHDVTVFTLRYAGMSYADGRYPFAVERLRPLITAGDAGWTPQLMSRLKGLDLVHLHYPFYGGAEWVWLAKLINRQKYIVTYHMDAQPEHAVKRLIQRVYDALLDSPILHGAEKVLVVDREYFLTAKGHNFISDERIVELPNGVDTTIFYPRKIDRTALGLPVGWQNKKILLFVGNLMPVKGLDLLIKAFEKLADPEVVLLVVGGNYDEKEYRQMVTIEHLGERIHFTGPCHDQNRLAEYYSVATCLVVPSHAESFSLVTIEALACSCPVVGSDIPGIRGRISAEIDGFLFASECVDSLTQELGRMLALTQSERTVMGERGRQKVLQKYSLDEHLKSLEKIYRSILSF